MKLDNSTLLLFMASDKVHNLNSFEPCVQMSSFQNLCLALEVSSFAGIEKLPIIYVEHLRSSETRFFSKRKMSRSV